VLRDEILFGFVKELEPAVDDVEESWGGGCGEGHYSAKWSWREVLRVCVEVGSRGWCHVWDQEAMSHIIIHKQGVSNSSGHGGRKR